MKRHSRQGLTLIELLLALAIFAVVLSSLYLSLRGGVLLYRRAEEGLDIHQSARLFLNRLEKELHNSIPYEAQRLEGQAHELTFPAVLRRFEKGQVQEDLFWVHYQFKEGRLVRESKRLKKEFSEAPAEKEEVLSGLVTVTFQYAFWDAERKEVTWKEAWPAEEQKTLPRAVQVSFTFKRKGPEASKQEVEGLTFTEKILIFQGQWGTEPKKE